MVASPELMEDSRAGAAELDMLLQLLTMQGCIPQPPWAAPGASSLCGGRRGELNREQPRLLAGIWERALSLLLSITFSTTVLFARVPWLLSPIPARPACSPIFLSQCRFPARVLGELVALMSAVCIFYGICV